MGIADTILGTDPTSLEVYWGCEFRPFLKVEFRLLEKAAESRTQLIICRRFRYRFVYPGADELNETLNDSRFNVLDLAIV